ncbi:MAG: YebC/PmpR family DNA-binding transcriptional regulator [Phycisphaeraceae bacterium]|nr:YebC/PmpR family DNA-binding transcriptional regulator [Phycisphaeraceae bacterium]
MAGHSAWKNIKHKKAAKDAKRGKAWTKCARAIIVAARAGGGDPDMNYALRAAVDDARAENMPRDTIENAIKKGTGELEGVSYESIIYEGYGPAGVAILLEILTDNRNRTAPDIKTLFQKHGGNLGSPGSVAYGFQNRGQIFIPKNAADEETVISASLEAGADDVIDDGEMWRVLTPPAEFAKVRQAIEKASLKIESAGLTMIPTNTIAVSGEDARKVLALVEALEDYDDVQKVHANFEIPDAELASIK